MIRVLLVDDQQLVRAGLRMLCASADDIEVVGEAANGNEALTRVEEVVPDLVVMDLRMPGMDGITATRRILDRRPGIRILVLTTFDDDEHLYPALSAGACGFLAKDAAPDELLDAVRRAAAGDSPFSRDVLRRLVAHAVDSRNPGGAPKNLPPLTAREREVLALIAAGLSNADIGERLHVGLTTVKTHVSNLMTKTGADNRVRLAMLAHQYGLTTG
ncbi:response regulator transcription factor [Amycolatopsis anabasis]|uniref:response regulator transcription factor n=1 Tax=Amycolatopsis anabasis TaxID=1840409 RepID=UPI00131DE277|nr:response regulator transcription factor [Amycolatopsis anabasis]